MFVTQALSRQVRKRHTHDRVIRIRQSTHLPEKAMVELGFAFCALHFTLHDTYISTFLL